MQKQRNVCFLTLLHWPSSWFLWETFGCRRAPINLHVIGIDNDSDWEEEASDQSKLIQNFNQVSIILSINWLYNLTGVQRDLWVFPSPTPRLFYHKVQLTIECVKILNEICLMQNVKCKTSPCFKQESSCNLYIPQFWEQALKGENPLERRLEWDKENSFITLIGSNDERSTLETSCVLNYNAWSTTFSW